MLKHFMNFENDTSTKSPKKLIRLFYTLKIELHAVFIENFVVERWRCIDQ